MTFSISSKGERLKHWYQALKHPNETHTMWHVLDLELDTKDMEEESGKAQKEEKKAHKDSKKEKKKKK